MDNSYLQHYGVKGMKWGVRRAEKKRAKYLDETKRKAEMHKGTAEGTLKSVKKLKAMSDSDYAKRFDDPEYLQQFGGAKKAKAAEIQQYEQVANNYSRYAKQWMNAHDEIMNTPIDELRSNKDYRKIINKHLNEVFAEDGERWTVY